MKCLFILVNSLLGAGALLFTPVVGAGGPSVPGLYCPVAGLGKEVQPDCCPKTPYTYHYKNYCSHVVTLMSPSVDYQGGKIYFCCEGCVLVFKKSPEKFTANAHLQLFATGQAKQVRCPLCGGDLNPAEEVGIGMVRVAVCSAACKKRLEQTRLAERLQLTFGDEPFGKAFAMRVKTAVPPR